MARNVTEIQRRLIALGYLHANGDDGKFGHMSLDAYNRFRATIGKGPVVQTSMAELNADLFPEDAPAKPKSKPSLFDNIGAILSITQLLKGKTMTSDQITGVIRAILAAVSGFFIAKGAGDADLWNWIIAGVTGIVPVVWTWVNNRPKTIAPIGK